MLPSILVCDLYDCKIQMCSIVFYLLASISIHKPDTFTEYFVPQMHFFVSINICIKHSCLLYKHLYTSNTKRWQISSFAIENKTRETHVCQYRFTKYHFRVTWHAGFLRTDKNNAERHSPTSAWFLVLKIFWCDIYIFSPSNIQELSNWTFSPKKKITVVPAVFYWDWKNFCIHLQMVELGVWSTNSQKRTNKIGK